MSRQIVMALIAIAMTTSVAHAQRPLGADCGDTAGPGGTRIACACGDKVVTTTELRPGDPVVTTVCDWRWALNIGVDNITLDCKGHTIAGTSRVGSGGIDIVSRRGITIQNCTISGSYVGIYLARSHDNDVVANTVNGPSSSGILVSLNSSGNRVMSNRVAGPGRWAVHLANSANGNIVEGNVLDGAFGGDTNVGITIDDAAQNVVKRNTISGFHEAGIALEGSSTRSNFVVDDDCHDNQTGIAVISYATRNIIDGNTTNLNRGDGMFLSANANSNTLTRNRGRLNAGSGLVVLGGRNLINEGTFDNNTAFGICAHQGNVDAGENRASGNGEGNISFDCSRR